MRDFDLAVVGSGFAGSLLAMIARRLGRSVIMLEKHSHPRTVIGESSTPLANLLLEELTTRYELPSLRSFAKWGSWQREHADIACGLKRGFSFFHHDLERPSPVLQDRSRQLLVAANPHADIADTHWYRADFDAYFVQEAQRLGVEYLDRVSLDGVDAEADGIRLFGTRKTAPFRVRAGLVVDATGPRGFLHQALGLENAGLPGYPATEAVYNHFTDVARLENATDNERPYPIDDAAVHHIFNGGWIWVLRFNNGITSAGAAALPDIAAKFGFNNGEKTWQQLSKLIPDLGVQFSGAKPSGDYKHLSRIPFRSSQICGERWALLPSAAGFVDPLLSTGFPLTLLGVKRLADAIETGSMDGYADNTERDLLAAADLIRVLYANMNRFQLFSRLSLLYFAAVSYAETVQRLGAPHLASSYLLREHPVFGPRSRDILRRAGSICSGEEAEELSVEILDLIEPIDVAGLRRNAATGYFPVDAEDLLASAEKVHASRERISKMLERSGFYAKV